MHSKKQKKKQNDNEEPYAGEQWQFNTLSVALDDGKTTCWLYVAFTWGEVIINNELLRTAISIATLNYEAQS